MLDPVCLKHGKRASEHEHGRCLYCCLCFVELTRDACFVDADGDRWDICEECAASESDARREL